MQGVGHGHVHHRDNCIFVKIFHVSLLVAVQKSNYVDISILLHVYFKMRSILLEKRIVLGKLNNYPYMVLE